QVAVRYVHEYPVMKWQASPRRDVLAQSDLLERTARVVPVGHGRELFARQLFELAEIQCAGGKHGRRTPSGSGEGSADPGAELFATRVVLKVRAAALVEVHANALRSLRVNRAENDRQLAPDVLPGHPQRRGDTRVADGINR